MMKTYSELITIPTFKERYEYLKLDGMVGVETFGFNRYLNQSFYRSKEWRDFRRDIIIRDQGCDLAHEEHPIRGLILIHHLNPITKEDIVLGKPCVLDPENAICTMKITHNAIHYGDYGIIPSGPIERKENDTCPWK